jgi:hypothetical protein
MKVRGLGAGLGASLPFPERRSLWMSWGGFRIVYYLCMYRPFGGLRFSIGRLRAPFSFYLGGVDKVWISQVKVSDYLVPLYVLAF